MLKYGKNHPYGEVQTAEDVDGITVELCKAYYATYFRPNISYLVIVGDINVSNGNPNHLKLIDWSRKSLGGNKNLILLNGNIQRLEEDGTVNIVKFEKTSFNLSGITTKSI